jgi:poly-gamma-glutamate capsule biosynthesis protein CapA/YwtB (metallophosphatase superfamily)
MEMVLSRRVLVLLVVAVLATAALWPWVDAQQEAVGRSGPVSIVLVGDLMVGRGVAAAVTRSPETVFAGVRHVIRSADLAVANLESPLTALPHLSPNPFSLQADAAAATVIAQAGFDVMSLANNHIGDAGPEGARDTIAAVAGAGMTPVGAGDSMAAAAAPIFVQVGSVTVAILAFDATGQGLAAEDDTGVAAWDPVIVEPAMEAARSRADVLIVSVHGGIEYLTRPDPRMEDIASSLVTMGADVVWGHGPHVSHPVRTTSDGRVVATSLGNFLFDQHGPETGSGTILEVLADTEGVIAFRVGSTTHRASRVRFEGWSVPEGDAVLLDGEWWTPVCSITPMTPPGGDTTNFDTGRVISASVGRITSPDRDEIAISYRKPAVSHPVRDGMPAVSWVDADGNVAQLGIYRLSDLAPVWEAGMVPAPVARVVACDGSVAMAYSGLDDPAAYATGAAVWRQWGLDVAEMLPGDGMLTCADVDGDGRTEPLVLRR